MKRRNKERQIREERRKINVLCRYENKRVIPFKYSHSVAVVAWRHGYHTLSAWSGVRQWRRHFHRRHRHCTEALVSYSCLIRPTRRRKRVGKQRSATQVGSCPHIAIVLVVVASHVVCSFPPCLSTMP